METFEEYKAKCQAAGIRLANGWTWEKSYENYCKDMQRRARR